MGENFINWVKNNWKWLLIVSIIFILTPSFFYIINFYSNPLSKNISDWGSFGEYINGTITPIISLISLFVVIIIAFLANKIQIEISDKSKEIIESQSDRDLKLQKKLALTDIRFKIYEDLSKSINNFIEISLKTNKSEFDLELILLKQKILDFDGNYSKFFKFENYTNIIKDVTYSTETYYEFIEKEKSKIEIDKIEKEKAFKDFCLKLENFQHNLQDFIINELDKN